MRITPRRVLDKLMEIGFNGFVSRLPNRVFGRSRPAALRFMGADIAPGVRISNRIKVLGARRLVIEDSAAVANSVILDARGGLTIKRGALVGFESVLISYTHAWPDPSRPVHQQGAVSAPIVLGENTWIGARVILLPGSTIGDATVIGAASVVSGEIAPMSVASGNPARVVAARRDRSKECASE